MAEHIHILDNELYRTCDYDHPCSWSKKGAPPLHGLRRSVAPQYWLDRGHEKRHLPFRAGRIR